MERFGVNDIFNDLELFGDFAGNAKSTVEGIVEDINETIDKYNITIKNTEAEITENEEAREKCKNEIIKMKDNINQINQSIENVQKTYQNIVDAYSKTSEGDTKDLYSEIIENARINCEDEVEKCEREITRLEDDIEAINNNITDFTNTIEQLHSSLDKQRIELSKFNKGLDYMKSTFNTIRRDLDNITNRKDIIKHVTRETSSLTKTTKEKPKKAEKPKVEKPEKVETKEEVKEKTIKEPKTGDYKNTFEDSLKQIYDLTGYSKKEEKKNTIEEENHLEDVFKPAPEPKKEEKSKNVFDNPSELSEWEKMLNSSYEEEPKKDNGDDKINVVNDLLKPYGTSFEKLKGYTSDKIEYKSGRSVPFELTPGDLTKAVNAINSIDLKQMKIVGPEITLLRKVKLMKEGS